MIYGDGTSNKSSLISSKRLLDIYLATSNYSIISGKLVPIDLIFEDFIIVIKKICNESGLESHTNAIKNINNST